MKIEEYDKWYESCNFIRKEMQFYSFTNFISEAGSYKKAYGESDVLIKQLYQWYVYANAHMSHRRKDAIWDYLNGYMSLKELRKY